MKSNARRRPFVLAGIIFLLAIGVAVMMSIGRKPAFPALPNPNGYDDLLKAGQAVTGKIDDAPDLGHDELHALIVTNAEALRLLRVGLSRRCAVPTEAEITNFANATHDLLVLKLLAKALSAEGRLAELENRPEDAVRSYVDTIRLGNEISHGGLIVNRFVGIACEGVGRSYLIKLLPKLNCRQLRPLVGDLQKIDDTTVPWKEVAQNESHFARAELGAHPNPIRLVSDQWLVRGMNRKSAVRHNLAAAHLRLLIVELALRAYRCDQDKAPESLTQLVPKYLQHLPSDPFSGKPLVYHSMGTNWLLYSLGPNRTDDGGKPLGEIIPENYLIGLGAGESANGDLFYDSKR